jgi:hypothetical protein
MALPKLFLEVIGVGGSANSMLHGMGRGIEARDRHPHNKP